MKQISLTMVVDEKSGCVKSCVVQTKFQPSFVKIFHNLGQLSCEKLMKNSHNAHFLTLALNCSPPGDKIKKVPTIGRVS